MISGRGLGHTGGTLDKLEAIPGFNVNLSLTQFRHVLQECGMGLDRPDQRDRSRRQENLRPARRYHSTVENIGLICGSIMSKKLAEASTLLCSTSKLAPARS